MKPYIEITEKLFTNSVKSIEPKNTEHYSLCEKYFYYAHGMEFIKVLNYNGMLTQYFLTDLNY